MRSFSGLYFYLRMVVFIVGQASYRLLKGYSENIWLFNEVWFPAGTVFLLTALMIAFIRPYQRPYMSYVDALLLSNLALCCFVTTSKIFILPVIKILFAVPMVAFILIVFLRKPCAAINFKKVHSRCCKLLRPSKLMQSQKRSAINNEINEEQLPVLQPANFNNYGTN